MPELLPVPDMLADAAGAPREGAFVGDPALASLEGALAPGLGLLARPDGAARRALRTMRRKTWCWVGVFHEDAVVAAAVADVGYLGVVWAYVAEGARLTERGWKAPGAVGVRAQPLGPTVARAPGRRVAMSPRAGGKLVLEVDLPGLHAAFDLAPGRSLTVVSDLGRGAGLPGATVKRCGLVARGAFEVEGRRRPLEGALACVDWTTGYFPRRTDWQWACGAGRDGQGRAVGWNLARGVHDDAAGRFTENALWIDGEPAALPPVAFTVGHGGGPWTVRSSGGEGLVDLVFEPAGERQEDVNLLLVSSRYRQPYGRFTGLLRDARGREARLERAPGVTEDHSATW